MAATPRVPPRPRCVHDAKSGSTGSGSTRPTSCVCSPRPRTVAVWRLPSASRFAHSLPGALSNDPWPTTLPGPHGPRNGRPVQAAVAAHLPARLASTTKSARFDLASLKELTEWWAATFQLVVDEDRAPLATETDKVRCLRTCFFGQPKSGADLGSGATLGLGGSVSSRGRRSSRGALGHLARLSSRTTESAFKGGRLRAPRFAQPRRAPTNKRPR